jgi:hypothetical protein
VKPHEWIFGTLELEEANRRRVSVGDKDVDEKLRANASAPLVTIAKYPEPTDKLNPSVKVVLRPLGQLQGKSPREIAQITARGMSAAIPSFRVEGDIEKAAIDGHDAAFFRSRFSITAGEQGSTFAVRSRTWLVPRGSYLFIIAMSGPETGEQGLEADFDRILRSVMIRK